MSDIRQHILAHRGLWSGNRSQNSIGAIEEAISAGFGVEIDIRSLNGNLVISHDLPDEYSPVLDPDISIWRSISHDTSIAYNVKEDGVSVLLSHLLERVPEHDGFAFDMSVPETITYVKNDVPSALRVSEYESVDAPLFKLFPNVKRVWLDSFESDWWMGESDVLSNMSAYRLYVVSPEIHGRDPRPVWTWFSAALIAGANVYLCTDHPEEVAGQCRV